MNEYPQAFLWVFVSVSGLIVDCFVPSCISGEIAEVIPAGELIQCLGLGEEVPCYLRMEGTVRNLHIDRRTTVELVHEICAAKVAHEIQNAHIVHTAHISAPNTAPKEEADSDDDSVSSGRPGSSTTFPSSPPRSPLSQLRPLSRMWEEGSEQRDAAEKAEQAYVPLLPTLPSNAGMAEFLECFLKVFFCFSGNNKAVLLSTPPAVCSFFFNRQTVILLFSYL